MTKSLKFKIEMGKSSFLNPLSKSTWGFGTGCITDPNPIRYVHLKLYLKNILPFVQLFFPLVVPLRIENYTLETRFPHKLCGILGRNSDSRFKQYCGNLYLRQMVEDFHQRLFWRVLSFRACVCHRRLPIFVKNVVIGGTTGNVEGLAKCMNLYWPIALKVPVIFLEVVQMQCSPLFAESRLSAPIFEFSALSWSIPSGWPRSRNLLWLSYRV